MADIILLQGTAGSPDVQANPVNIGSSTPKEVGVSVNGGLDSVTADGSTLFLRAGVTRSRDLGNSTPGVEVSLRADDWVNWTRVSLANPGMTDLDDYPGAMEVPDGADGTMRDIRFAKGPNDDLVLVSYDQEQMYLNYLRVRQVKGVTADHATTDAIEGIIDQHTKDFAQDGGREIALGDTDFADKFQDSVSQADSDYTEATGVLNLQDNAGTPKSLQIGRAFTDAEKLKLESMEQGARGDQTGDEIVTLLEAQPPSKRLDAAAVKNLLDAGDVENLIEAHDQVSGAVRLEKALRQEKPLVSNVPVNFQGNGLAQSISGRPKIPPGDHDREFEIKIGSGTWHTFTNSDLLAKSETTPPSTMDDLSSLSYTEGGVTYRIGRHVTDDEFLVSSSQDGTQNVSIRDYPIDIPSSLLGGVSSQDLKHRDALPSVSDFQVGDLTNVQGVIYRLTDDQESGNVISGISALHDTNYYGDVKFAWQTVSPFNIRMNLSKAALGSSPPGTIYVRFHSGNSYDYVTMARASAADTATEYRYHRASGSDALNDDTPGPYQISLWTSFASDKLSGPVQVHSEDRWEVLGVQRGSGISVEDQGVSEGDPVDTLNFTGSVDVTRSGSKATVNVTGGGSQSGSVYVSRSPDSEVNITSVNGATSSWQNIVSLPAITAEQAGLLIFMGEVHAEASGAPSGGGDRVITEGRIRKRTAAGVVSTLMSHNDYGPRNLAGGNANTSSDFSDKSKIGDETLIKVAMAAEGDVYTLQARVTGQIPNQSQVVDFDASHNSIAILRFGGVKGDKGDPGTPGQDGTDGTSSNAITDLQDGSDQGLSVTSAASTLRTTFQLFDPEGADTTFDLDDSLNGRGIIDAEFRLSLSQQNPSAISFGTGDGRIVGWTHASTVRSSAVYSATQDQGVEIGRASVFNGSTELGYVKGMIARNSLNELGRYISFTSTGGQSTQSFALGIHTDAEFFHQDGAAPSVTLAGLGGLTQSQVDSRVRSASNAATVARRGNVELADNAESDAGTVGDKALTPAGGARLVDAKVENWARDDSTAIPSSKLTNVSSPVKLWGDISSSGGRSEDSGGFTSRRVNVNTGQYVITFSTARSNNRYAVVASCDRYHDVAVDSKTTTGFNVYTTQSGNPSDAAWDFALLDLT